MSSSTLSQWDVERDLASRNSRVAGDRDITTAGKKHGDSNKREGERQNGDSGRVESGVDCGRDGSCNGTTGVKPQTLSSNDDVAASSDKMVTDGRQDAATGRGHRTTTTTTIRTPHSVLATWGETETPVDYGPITANIAATAVQPVSSHRGSRNTPADSTAATGNVESPVLSTGDSAVSSAQRDERSTSPGGHADSSTTEPDAEETGKVAATGTDQVISSDVDQISAVNVATKPLNKYATQKRPDATTKGKIDVLKTRRNILSSSVTRKNGSSPAENVAVGKDDFLFRGGVDTDENAADQTANRKSPRDVDSSRSPSGVQPAIAAIIKTLSVNSRDFSSVTAVAEKLSIDAKQTAAVVNGVDDTTTADTVPIGVKHTNAVSPARENHRNIADSGTAEQSRTSRVSRLPRPNRDATGGLASVSVESGSDAKTIHSDPRSCTVDPLGARLVRVDRLLRSVGPTSVRHTGVATPAVQALMTASVTATSDDTSTTDEPRTAPGNDDRSGTERNDEDTTLSYARTSPPYSNIGRYTATYKPRTS